MTSTAGSLCEIWYCWSNVLSSLLFANSMFSVSVKVTLVDPGCYPVQLRNTRLPGGCPYLTHVTSPMISKVVTAETSKTVLSGRWFRAWWWSVMYLRMTSRRKIWCSRFVQRQDTIVTSQLGTTSIKFQTFIISHVLRNVYLLLAYVSFSCTFSAIIVEVTLMLQKRTSFLIYI